MQLPSAQLYFIALGVSEISLALLKRSGGSTVKKDRSTFGLLWLVIGVSIGLSFFVAGAVPYFGYPFALFGYGTGVVFFCGGVLLRWWSIIHLGRFFTVDVAIAQDHTVVSDGPYRLVRHPGYSGVLLSFLGLGLLLHNGLAALLLIVPIFVALLWRIKVEEEALTTALGKAYTDYMARTRRLVPWLY
ncbi:MAG TPA: isoprenylcysteine carboxylmethyltransferase family protein [Flavobacteriales bacterium]|nr:isoprenylcysteine carboxylmethyltransferase family protein [Flavobacteriales bacterium]HNI02994.1 isoprenylcysteine carboxylmethyltransferase family protein [Flavobacteriales bacterium]HNK40613.1 isoprenylcysteine carboxylmethyltransferase family protein [Flavobacteriales bacterium]HNK67297.1 isoprenylcysteine carboxylmethyltransferase family protein [Flavobacteriales bacterium]